MEAGKGISDGFKMLEGRTEWRAAVLRTTWPRFLSRPVLLVGRSAHRGVFVFIVILLLRISSGGC